MGAGGGRVRTCSELVLARLNWSLRRGEAGEGCRSNTCGHGCRSLSSRRRMQGQLAEAEAARGRAEGEASAAEEARAKAEAGRETLAAQLAAAEQGHAALVASQVRLRCGTICGSHCHL